MLIQSSTRALCLVGALAPWIVAHASSAQTDTERRTQTAERPAAELLDPDPVPTATTAGATNQEILDLLNNVSDRVDTAISRATAAKDAAEEVRTGVRDGVSALTGQLRTAISGALSDLNRIVAEELGGAEFLAFTDGPDSCSPTTCEPFRQELLTLLLDLESSANGLFSVIRLDQMQLDLQRLRGVIANLPGRVLFPLYLALQVDNGDLLGALSNLLSELAADLTTLADVFATETTAASAAGPGTPLCTAMVENPILFEEIIIRNAARAIALKIIAKIFDALGETSATADAGVHGYVHITYEENFPKKFASILESLSDSEFYIADTVEAKLQFCLMLQVQIDAQQRQVELLDGQARILDAIRGNADLDNDGNVNLNDYEVLRQQLEPAAATP